MTQSSPEGERIEPPTFHNVLREAFDNRVALAANFIGVLGVYPLAYYLLSLTNSTGFWGASIGIWSGILGTAVLFGLVGYSIYNLATAYYNTSEKLRQRLERSEELRGQAETRVEEIRREAEHAATVRPFREMQKRAVEAISTVYGFEINRAEYHYRIWEDGSAEGNYKICFKCHRRALASWVQSARSSLVQLKESEKPSMPDTEVQVQTHAFSAANTVVEEFVFSPTIKPDGKVVPLSFSDNQPPGTFLTGVPNKANREYDWVAVYLREPVAHLSITVSFEGFKPEFTFCEAVFGAAQQVLERESLEAKEALQEMKQGASTHIAKMELPYPIMGVLYRLKWKLPKVSG